MRQGHLDHPTDGESIVVRQAVPSLRPLDVVLARKRTLGEARPTCPGEAQTALTPGHGRTGQRQQKEQSSALGAKPRSWWTAAEIHWQKGSTGVRRSQGSTKA